MRVKTAFPLNSLEYLELAPEMALELQVVANNTGLENWLTIACLNSEKIEPKEPT
jgi:hypothetical protein